MGMAIKIIDHNSAEYQKMVQLRNQILRTPLGLSFTKEDLEKEKDDILIAAFEEEAILGCCLLTKTAPDIVRLRQMAVLNNVQGKGIGRQMMQFAENVARDYGNQKITMHARLEAIGFYEKQGYKKLGTEFTEVTLPHYLMEKQLR
jgi:N-acetylglutamate synthase-like GNAT family acetyltransferase